MKHTNCCLIIRIVVVAFFWLPRNGASQVPAEIKFKHLSIDDGLSQNSVHCIIQDRRGFMWFGTQDGLNRFDGYRFSVYRNDPQDSTAISNSWVQSLLEDHQGILWVGTDGGGLNRYDTRTKAFHAFKNDPNDPSSVSHNRIFSLCEDHTGRLWVGTYGGGLSRYNERSDTFTAFKNEPADPASLSNNEVLCVYEDRAAHLWVGTFGGGLNLYDEKSNTFTSFKNDPQNPLSVSDDRIRTMYQDRSGRLWVGTYSGLNLFDPQTKTFTSFGSHAADLSPLTNNAVFSIHEDPSGLLWIGTFGGGISVFSPETKTFTSYRFNPKEPSSLSDNSVYALYEDRSGLVWAGTYSGGINFFDPKTKAFQSFNNDPNDAVSLTDNRVRSIFEDRSGRLWVGTYGGLNLYDPKTGSFRVFRHDAGDPRSLSENRVRIIFEDHLGRLWVGTNAAGLNRMDKGSGTFTIFKNDPNDPASLSNNSVWSIFEDGAGRLWIGTSGGRLNRLDPNANHFQVLQGDPDDRSFSNDAILSIAECDSDRLWVGTSGGLRQYAIRSNTFSVFRSDPDDSTTALNNRIRVIYKDHTERLWLGTDGGLCLLEPGSKKFRTFREKQGLPSDVIYGILEGAHGRLWLSTNKGISRFDPGRETFRNFDITDGLLSNEFNQNAYFKDRNGWMYFGGIGGYNRFHPDSIRYDPFVPPVVITGLEIFNREVDAGMPYPGFVLPASISESDELILSYRESVFTLEFSALVFAQPLKNKYAYRLGGFDKDWNYTDARRRFATYTNLDPGTYIFQVKGSNHDGVWNEEGRSLKIVITPPWWKTWWADFFYALLFTGLVMGFIRIQVNRAKSRARDLIHRQREEARIKEAELRTQAAESESRALRAEDQRKQEELEKAKELAAINENLQSAIRQLRETQAQLVQKEKMASLGQMTAGIAHEINNPLTFVHGNLDFFKQGIEKIVGLAKSVEGAADDNARGMAADGLAKEIERLGGDMISQLDSGLSGTRRIKEIVENLRKFARVGESGTKKTSVNENLEAILDLFVKQHDGIRIERRFGDVVDMIANVSELNQCYLNILTNAIQAIREAEKSGSLKPGAGVITIQTESKMEDSGKWVRVFVTDNGIGIPESHKDKIFDPFFTTRAIGQGRGLGLAESYGIIHKHGGTIEVLTKEGEGSSFVITLPGI